MSSPHLIWWLRFTVRGNMFSHLFKSVIWATEPRLKLESICCDTATVGGTTLDQKACSLILIEPALLHSLICNWSSDVNWVENMLKNELADVCAWAWSVLECVRLCEWVRNARVLRPSLSLSPARRVVQTLSPLYSVTHTHTLTHTHKLLHTNKQTLTGVHVMTYVTKYT